MAASGFNLCIRTVVNINTTTNATNLFDAGQQNIINVNP